MLLSCFLQCALRNKQQVGCNYDLDIFTIILNVQSCTSKNLMTAVLSSNYFLFVVGAIWKFAAEQYLKTIQFPV